MIIFEKHNASYKNGPIALLFKYFILKTVAGGAPALPKGTPVIHGPPPILSAPILAQAGGDNQGGTAFSNPLLSSAPPGMMSHLPQFVASPPTSAPSMNSNSTEDV